MPKRDQWIYTTRCGCPVGVAEGYLADSPAEAMQEMYDTPISLARAGARGITAKLITWDQYEAEYYEKMLTSYSCKHETAA